MKGLLSWLAAAMVAAVLCNCALWLCHDPAVWIAREGGATDAIWHPGARLVMGTEGRGVHRVDSRGYLNPEKPLGSDYVLVVGSSFTQGKEVPAGQRFSDILNRELSGSDGTLAVYNVSQDGFYLPDILRCFPALMAEFPDAGALVIEIGTTAFSEDALLAEPDIPDPAARGPALMQAMPSWRKLILQFKEALPILTLGKSQLMAMKTPEPEKSLVPATAEKLKTALTGLRRQFDGEIYILYHPPVTLSEDGMAVAEEKTTADFRAACEDTGLIFVDVSWDFLAAYEETWAVPYGFSNTAPASGHLNAQGHRVCAEALLPLLKGGGGE